VEIDDQAEWNVEQLHVAEQLRLVDGDDALDGFHLDQEASLDEKVVSEFLLFGKAFIRNDYSSLRFTGETAELKFLRQAPFINRFDQSRSLVAMDFNRRSDHRFSKCRRLLEGWVHASPWEN